MFFSKDSYKASNSSFVFMSEKLIRSEQSASSGVSPKASNVPLGWAEWEEHADPLETKMPSADRA